MAAEQHSVKVDTTYAILKQDGHGWIAVGTKDARDAETAIKALVATLAPDDQDGKYVAIPARSWKPVTVAVKVERSLVIGGAS